MSTQESRSELDIVRAILPIFTDGVGEGPDAFIDAMGMIGAARRILPKPLMEPAVVLLGQVTELTLGMPWVQIFESMARQAYPSEDVMMRRSRNIAKGVIGLERKGRRRPDGTIISCDDEINFVFKQKKQITPIPLVVTNEGLGLDVAKLENLDAPVLATMGLYAARVLKLGND